MILIRESSRKMEVKEHAEEKENTGRICEDDRENTPRANVSTRHFYRDNYYK